MIEMHQAAEIFDPKAEMVYKYLQVGVCSGSSCHELWERDGLPKWNPRPP